MDNFQGVEAFVRVAQTKSYLEAAQILRVSKSVVSTRIKLLEELVKTPLLNRNSRTVTLSEAGRTFYPECEELVTRVTSLVEQMRDLSGQPSGVLRVHALPGFVLGHFGGLLGQFHEKYPEISLDLIISDEVVDPVREGFDCVLQIFEPVSEELVSQRLFAWRGVFCASPDYLQRHGAPVHPQDLERHRLGLYSRYPWRNQWQFKKADEALPPLKLSPAMQSNSVHLLRDYGLAGSGVVCIPTFIAAPDLLAGRLRVVIPDYDMPMVWLCAVYPVAQRGQLKLRLFLEQLAAQPGSVAPWDQALIERGLLRGQGTSSSFTERSVLPISVVNPERDF